MISNPNSTLNKENEKEDASTKDKGKGKMYDGDKFDADKLFPGNSISFAEVKDG